MSKYVKDFGNYSVKNVKSFMGREGMGFNCNLYRNGKKVGFCMDDASGGGMHPIDWVGTPSTHGDSEGWDKWRSFRDEEQRLLSEHIKSLPKVNSHGMELEIDEGWFVNELVSEWEQQRDIRKIKKQCQGKTLFRHSGCSFGGYVIMSSIFNDQVRESLKKKYGEDVEIFNDVMAEGKLPSVFSK